MPTKTTLQLTYGIKPVALPRLVMNREFYLEGNLCPVERNTMGEYLHNNRAARDRDDR